MPVLNPAPQAPLTVNVAPGAVTTVTNPIRPPTDDERTVINAAEAQRSSALTEALAQVSAFLGRSNGPFSADEQTLIGKILRWLLLPSVNAEFWPFVQKFHDLMAANQALGTLTHSVDIVRNDNAYVYFADQSRGVFLCAPRYFCDNGDCQREVIIHEYFHFIVGGAHFYGTTVTEEAIKCPHHLAELVSDIATGRTLGCQRPGACR